MNIGGMIFGVVCIAALIAFVEYKCKLNNKLVRNFKILIRILYIIEYLLIIVIGYFSTDTWLGFFIVNSCFFVINTMYLAIYRDWFKNKLYLRLILAGVVPFVTLFIIIYGSRYVLA